jgi:hypothetical protein
LLGNRKKIAKFLMRTFACCSTFLYDYNELYMYDVFVGRHTNEVRLLSKMLVTLNCAGRWGGEDMKDKEELEKEVGKKEEEE